VIYIINIRENIMFNFKNLSENDIKNSINESIKTNDEIILPGLGVFFEILWKNSNKIDQKKIVEIIKNNI
jgi:small acid-soluble spore protein I (minor)